MLKLYCLLTYYFSVGLIIKPCYSQDNPLSDILSQLGEQIDPNALPSEIPDEIGQTAANNTDLLPDELRDQVLPEQDDAFRLFCNETGYYFNGSDCLPCEAGFFCPLNSDAKFTCDYRELVGANGDDFEVPCQSRTVWKMFSEGEPMAGNYCPEESVIPNLPCPAGYYCPTPAEQIRCPSGYYCRRYSKEPSRCPFLASCPEGSSAPELTWAGFVGIVIIVFVVAGIFLLAIYLIYRNQGRTTQNSETRDALQQLASVLVEEMNMMRWQTWTVDARINIFFDKLGLSLKNGKVLLSGVSGQFQYGRLYAVMGPSGAGKTTFLNVLLGKASYGKPTGTMRIFVHPRKQKPFQTTNMMDIQEIRGFVPQDDIVHEDLTVRENLLFNALLRLRRDKITKTKKIELVMDVLDLLCIAHVQHTVVGSVERRGISGGQRKRVNIGWELCAKPSVLFLDEPTSGLDSTASGHLVHVLDRISQQGMNIISIIHQPRYSIFVAFHEVLLLAKGGRTAYLGSTEQALDYFEGLGFQISQLENPADFCLDVISGENTIGGFNMSVDEIVKAWEDRASGVLPPAPSSARGLKSWFSTSESKQLGKMTSNNLKMVISQRFDELDEDKNGSLSASELSNFFANAGNQFSSIIIQKIITEITQGENREITKQDFQGFLQLMISNHLTTVTSRLPPTPRQAPVIEENLENGAQSSRSAVSSNGKKEESFYMKWMGGKRKVRCTPGVWQQFIILSQRCGNKWLRNYAPRMFDTILVIIAALVLGMIQGSGGSRDGAPQRFLLVCLAQGLLYTMASLKTFGKDRVVYWRERSFGLSALAYFFAQTSVNFIDVVILPLIFNTIYYGMVAPEVNFGILYAVGLLTAWYSFGLGYFMSVLLQPMSAQITALAISLMAGAFINGVQPRYKEMDPPLRIVAGVSYARWGVEVLTIVEYEGIASHIRSTAAAVIYYFGYCFTEDQSIDDHEGFETEFRSLDEFLEDDELIDQYNVEEKCYPSKVVGLLALFGIGVIFRVFTVLALVLVQRGKQR